ncbi:MAG TPA: undecaprenyl-diphosphatase [Clostridia bacterium]|nr:undecaprenyl-diphosphatase [Clostridia bacterium]
MTIWEGIVLGIIQGLTEFFPVSSSGHLVIFTEILGVQEAGLVFDVLVHFGTLLAVMMVYRADIVSILKRPFQKLTWLLLAGAVPTGVIGLVFHDVFTEMFESVLVTGCMLLVTGTILWLVDRYASAAKPLEKMSYGQAVFVGLAQGLAILPGLSRSGTTIAAALVTGLDRQSAPRYSFLLSIPVILGATVLELKDIVVGDINSALLVPYLAGMVAAMAAGYCAITLFIRFVRLGKLHYFSYYCWLVGLLVVLWQLV